MEGFENQLIHLEVSLIAFIGEIDLFSTCSALGGEFRESVPSCWDTSCEYFFGARDSVISFFGVDSRGGSELGVERGEGVSEALKGTLISVLVAGSGKELVEFFMLRERRLSAGDLKEEGGLCVIFVTADAESVDAISLLAEILSLAT